MRLLVVFFLISLSNIVFSGNTDQFSFRHFTIDNGLSNSNVNCIVQDNNGFIWLGTENGLNKFDGYKFTQYYSDINQTKSLYSNEVLSLMVDSRGLLWVGTFQGLFVYNESYDNFDYVSFEEVADLSANIPVLSMLEFNDSTIFIATSGRGIFKYVHGKGIEKAYLAGSKPFGLSSDFVNSLCKVNNETLLVGTTSNGLDVFNVKSEQFVNYKPSSDIHESKVYSAILKIQPLNEQNFLLGTRGDGMFIFNFENKQFSKYTIPGIKTDAQPLEVYSIFNDTEHNLWIGSHGNGLFCVNENYTLKLKHNEADNTSLINDNVRTFFKDRQGDLWIVSYQGGVNLLPNIYKKFSITNLESASEYSSNIVTSICNAQNNNIWIGTDGGGLKHFNRNSNKISHYHPGNGIKNIIDDKVVMAMMPDGDELYIGTYMKGLYKYNTRTGVNRNYQNTNHKGSISHNFVSCIYKSARGVIWVGTVGGGINKLNSQTGEFERFVFSADHINDGLVNDFVNTITEDNNGRLWIGTFWGLSIYDPLNSMFVNYTNMGGAGGLSNNTIYSIKITRQNQVWLGTRNGLNKFVPESNSFVSYNLAEGLPGNVIYSIEEDNTGKLWLSTNNGLCCFNPKTTETVSYFKTDGLPSNEYFRNASYISPQGELFFGSLNGLVSFYPDSLNENYEIPQAVITRFKIFDQEVLPGKAVENKMVLVEPIYKTQSIELPHRFNSFGFEFSALDFMLPEKVSYKCKMEGFDSDWRQFSYDHRYITYTNLDAGTYTFKVMASSIDNEWNNQTTDISLTIKPPLYRTWWAYLLYYVLLITIVALFWSFSLKRVKLKNEIKLERIERDKDNEVNQAKLRFFTNVSHEFRTPITLIMGPIEKMLNDKAVGKKYGETLSLMQKNASRLLRLINQIMDLRKVEAGQMQLKAEKANIVPFLNNIYASFQELALQKNIEYNWLSQVENQDCWFDADKIDKIFFNLLSNAFKFTDANGTIVFSVIKHVDQENNEYLRIAVADTGIGIPESDKDKVFDRFYQTSEKHQNYNAGSGVGLSLTKSLVEQHHGNISFTSELGKGTTFEVLIPVSEHVYADEEKFSVNVYGNDQYAYSKPYASDENSEDAEGANEKHQTLLVVEDNFDLRKYIVSEFSDRYNVLEAANGKLGLDLALQELPDLIISDIVMPEMDGLELCKQVKQNFLTNHIPIILLTARASIEHRIQGLNQGADSYIPKPFTPEHLKIRVTKLIEIRSVLRQKYSEQLSSSEIQVESEEDVYLKELKDFILDNLDDPDLNIEKLCKEMGISRAHFYRKIKQITDKSPTEFVRIIRLNEAAKILMDTKKTVSEVCYMVGFSSPSYFSICFKDHFKISPVDFVKKNR